MGLDATIKRPDGEPLGRLEEVQWALAVVFPGIVFGHLPSGADKVRLAEERGLTFPKFLRESLLAMPAKFGADYTGPEFSAQFVLGTSDIVQHIDVALYGTTTASEVMFRQLEEQNGWVTTHP